MKRLAIALAIVAGARGLAAAHGPDAIFDPLTMDRHTPVSTLDLDFAYVAYDEPANTDVTAVGITIGGQYVTPKGIGGYLSVPLSYVGLQVDLPAPLGVDDSELALGNIELGGLYAKYLASHAAIVVHGGIALPTAGDEGVAANQILASSPRYGDLVQRATNSTWLRLGLSPMGRSGKLFWRADVGLDLALDEDNAATISPVFRVSVGGGIDLRTAHLLAELVTVVVDDGSDDESASTFAIGARFVSGKLRPGVALIVPIGFDGALFDVDFAIAFSLAARL